MKISNQIDGCTLSVVGKLPFNFWAGSCTASKDEVYLCFDGLQAEKQSGKMIADPKKPGDLKTCWKSSDAVSAWTKVENSTYHHRSIKIATSDCKSS